MEEAIGRNRTDRYGTGTLLIYLTLSVFFFGRSLAGHMSNRYMGSGPDPSQFMWYMRWWPYAIAHHLNPFIPRVVWPPGGVNIAWAASMPLPSLAAWPLTKLFGLIPSYNVLCLLCPALAGWSAFLVCRQVSRSYWPSVLGGFVFAFSAHMDGKVFGNLNDAFVFAIPLALYAGLLWLERRIRTGTFVGALAALLVVQFLCFIELFATMTLAGALAWTAGMLSVDGERRNRLHEMIKPIIASYAIAAAILSPYLYFLLAHRLRSAEFMPAEAYSVDLLNFFIPTPLNELGAWAPMRHIARLFTASLAESGGYLGLPAIVIAFVFHRWHRREPAGRVMTMLLLGFAVLAMGPHLHIAGRATMIPLPWKIFTVTPFIQKALPARLMLYVFLDLAIMASVVLNELEVTPAAKTMIAAALALFMLPNLSASYWSVSADVPEFFSAGLFKTYLKPHENVIIMPYSIYGDAILWQAESDMYFDMVQGWTGFPQIPKEFEKWPMVQSLTWVTDLPEASTQLKAFIAAYNIQGIVVAEDCFCGSEIVRDRSGPTAWKRVGISTHDRNLWRKWFSSLGIIPVETGGVLLYKVRPGQFDSYKQYSLDELQAAATRQRFDILLAAVANYVRVGGDVSKLSPARAAELNLIPADWISGHNLPPDPETAPLRDRIVLSKADNGDAAIGLIATYGALEPIVRKYRPFASQVIYISPDPPYRHMVKPVDAGPLLLIMSFAKPSLQAAAERIEAEGITRESRPVQHDEAGASPPG
jgi:uncharacterized membrane protein